ncbi:MAG: NUDIX hydrolase [Candidatus Thorarchaeota archaeon]
MDIYWTGQIRCKDVRWILKDEEYLLDDALEKLRKDVWEDIQRNHPDTYDGHLLTLSGFENTKNSMTLRMNTIRFSRILTLEKVGKRLKPYGTIGMQLIVLTPDKQHILIGQRSKNSMYCPLFFSVPGGMLEVTDASDSFEDACLREFHEEVKLDIKEGLDLVGITSEIHGSVGVVFLILGTAKELSDLSSAVQGNEEWEDRRLEWHSIQQMERMTRENSLEGVVFAKDDRKKKERGGPSVLW